MFDAGITVDTLLNNALKALAGMERAGKLPLRYRASVYIDKRDINGEEVARNIQQKRRAFASDLVDVHTAKIANDGTIEGETAAVLKQRRRFALRKTAFRAVVGALQGKLGLPRPRHRRPYFARYSGRRGQRPQSSTKV